MASDLYAVLGVPKTADADAIKKAYRKLAKELHPDRNPGNAKTEARFKEVNHAFDVLGDPAKRKIFDEFGEEGLREGFDPERARAYSQWAGQQRGGGGFRGGRHPPGGGTEEINLEDLFSGRVGGGGAAGGVGDMFGDLFGRGRRTRGPSKGQDFESQVTIDFISAVRGTTLELRPQGATAPTVVRIPPGAAEGSRVRIAGQGGPSPNGGPSGDMILEIHVEPHRFFRREGDDLHLDVPVTVAEAYQGAKVKVPTIDGAVTLKVAARTQSGTVVRVRGKGVVRKDKTPGDLYVHYQVHVPTGDDPELHSIMEKLALLQPEDPRRDIRV